MRADAARRGRPGFRLAPRINAAGRLYRADAGVELMLTEDEARAEEIAIELSRANSERRATRARGRHRRRGGAARAARGAARGAGAGRWPARTGIPAWSGSSPRGWSSATTGRWSSISLDGEGEAGAAAAASRASTCWRRWRRARSTWRASAGTAPPPASRCGPRTSSLPRGLRGPRGRGARAPRICGGPSGSTRWSAASASASSWPRSWASWPRSGWATRACG